MYVMRPQTRNPILWAFVAAVLVCSSIYSVLNDLTTSQDVSTQYDRDSFGFVSYKPGTDIGFYTKNRCKTSIDHVVSLKDAFLSGASMWEEKDKVTFSNDRLNHVAACMSVNSSKAAAVPSIFIARSNDGKGLDYELVELCDYLSIYYAVKNTYNLSFTLNDAELFAGCGLTIE